MMRGYMEKSVKGVIQPMIQKNARHMEKSVLNVI